MGDALTRAVPLALILVGGHLSVEGQQACSTDWRLSETLRIGSLDGEDALASVNDLAVSPSGDIYVTQQWAGSVTVFSSDGRLARTIGRSGEGPGEFNPSPITLSFVGDTLWVGDWSRAQAFGPLGQPLDFARFQVYVPEEASQYWADSPLRDGSFWSRRSTRINSRHVPDGPGTGLRAIRRFSPEGEVLDTIAMLDGRDRYVEYGPDEFTKHPLWKLLPDTWLIGWRDMLAADRSSIVLLGDVREEPGSASFDLLRIGIWGDTLLMRSVPYEPRPFSRALEAWWRDEFGKFMAGDYTRGLSDWGQRTEPDTREAREKAREGFLAAAIPPASSPGDGWGRRDDLGAARDARARRTGPLGSLRLRRRADRPLHRLRGAIIVQPDVPASSDSAGDPKRGLGHDHGRVPRPVHPQVHGFEQL